MSDKPLPVCRLTLAELLRLPEYSCTNPTGTTIGKRWRSHTPCRRSCPTNSPCPHWFIAEYVRIPTPGMVGINWSKALIGEPLPPAPPPRIQRWTAETD